MSKTKIYFLLSIFFVSLNCQKEASTKKDTSIICNLKIRAGLVMKSGDIKKVARQELIILKDDLVELWDNSKSDKWKQKDVVDRDIKENLEFENRMTKLKGAIADSKIIIQRESARVQKEIEDHIAKSGGLLQYSDEDNKFFVSLLIQYEMQKLKDNELGEINYNNIKEVIKLVESHYYRRIVTEGMVGYYEKILRERYEIFKEIEKKANEVERNININNEKIRYNNNQIEVTKKEIENKANGLHELSKRYFKNLLEKSVILTTKTNLDGEIDIVLNKGNYHIFGLAQLAENYIVWNLPIIIKNNNEYIELSNDNAYSLNNMALYQELFGVLK
jgi:hypothetical protein